ncbi:unnamed protein product [Pseudo-nitzschia multistriata]|uniref:Phosphatidic acid phosphatase type 2/haloperoxidase domain-containing protein n=1 Tax=Pseudo-nitzschia multistriata TaxID=183589 RepID=A0A448ZPU2_9STRA|nr:unnamed protein product [Pseudo-nitzschia multistriata]
MKFHLILGCATLVVAGTALVALFGSRTQEDGSATRKLRFNRLPVVYVNEWYGDDWWSSGDDWWGTDDYSKGDDWWGSGDDGFHHGGHGQGDDWHNDDYTFEYKPVASEFIKVTNGGYGGKSGRSLSELRFNKVPPVIEGYNTNAFRYTPSRDYVQGVHTALFPLMPSDYPLTGEKANIVRRETMADAVVLSGDIQLHGDSNPTVWLNRAGVTPIYPSDPAFWDELRPVVEAQIARRSGVSPSQMNYWPDSWADKTTLDAVAEAVQGEYPGLHQSTIIEKFFKDGVEMYRDMYPFRSVVDFIGTDIRLAAINTWAFEAVAPINFMLKWHYGVPRPEEVAWMIYKGQYTEADGVPADLVALIKSMDMEYATSFTAYVDGSPTHPSFPAMHSAGSTCSYWMPAVCDLSPEQYCEALRVDYAVAYARTIAGVHYPNDNYAGLNLGQRIIKEKLPPVLAEKYGYDEAKVARKLEALAFDWHDFDSSSCTIAGVSAADFLAAAKLN